MSSIKFVNKKDRELKFEFRCLGDEYAEVDLICCFESESILEYVGRGFALDRPIGIPKNIIEMVNEFCVSRWKTINTITTYHPQHAGRMLEDFDWNFVSKQPLSVLVQLSEAASKLRIKSLLNLAHNAIVVRLVKESDEIHKIFNVSGFTRKAFKEAVEEMHVCGGWA